MAREEIQITIEGNDEVKPELTICAMASIMLSTLLLEVWLYYRYPSLNFTNPGDLIFAVMLFPLIGFVTIPVCAMAFQTGRTMYLLWQAYWPFREEG